MQFDENGQLIFEQSLSMLIATHDRAKLLADTLSHFKRSLCKLKLSSFNYLRYANVRNQDDL